MHEAHVPLELWLGFTSQYMYVKSLYSWIQLVSSSYKFVWGEPDSAGFQNTMKVKKFWIFGCKGSLERNRKFLRLLKRRKRWASSYTWDWNKHPGHKKPGFSFCVPLKGTNPTSLTSTWGPLAAQTKGWSCAIIQERIQNSQAENWCLLLSNNDSGAHLECEKCGSWCTLRQWPVYFTQCLINAKKAKEVISFRVLLSDYYRNHPYKHAFPGLAILEVCSEE